ncbi:MAG: HlyC/CorC family transporter [Betaproteobacteria bacterium]|nr:hemolysin family protein [Burkholderiales bacterium]NBX13852.1 HlyC/CorC family transporter [Betaproteobacteria bacterium]NBX89122.1 HlyC/CorC family transporter [Betaproteobacteria bacterium]
MDFLLIAFLTLVNGVFAMSELALASSRKARLAAMQEAGDKGAGAALKLLENPTQFLSTVQVGITSIGVLNGIVGEAAFSQGVAVWLVGLGMAGPAAGIVATALVVTAITFTTIIFGELVPKRIGQLYPEPVARWVSRPMAGLASAAKPFVQLLSLTTHGVLKLLRIDTRGNRAVTEEEITASLEEGVDAGLIEEHEHQMVRNVFHLDDRPLTSLMVPRGDIEWLDASLTPSQSLAQAGALGGKLAHSWYPVCRGGLDDVVGVISVAQLLGLPLDDPRPIEQVAQVATFVPETLSGMELLEQLRARAGRMVFVVDEYGVVQGLLTPRDLLEAITGELRPPTLSQAWATHRADGSWLLDGLMPINELKSRLDIKHLPGDDKGLFNTLGGFILAELGYLPEVGDILISNEWQFEVLELEGRRIDKVNAQLISSGKG